MLDTDRQAHHIGPGPGERDNAMKLLFGDMRPATDAYMGAIRNLIDFQDNLMKKAGKDAAETYASARLLVVALSIAALVLGLGIALFITRSITRPVNEALGVTQRMADGDLTVTITDISKDEIGQMLGAQQTLIAQLNQLYLNHSLNLLDKTIVIVKCKV